MAKTKSDPKKSAKEKTMMVKIAGQVGHLAGEIVAGKDHLMEMAGDAIESMKSTIHNITTKKKAVPKAVIKTAPKKAVPKTAQPVTKKAANAAAAKKTAPPKKSIPKATKRAAVKK